MSLIFELSKLKNIPLSFLQGLGITNSKDGLLISYGQGNRVQVRHGLKSKEGFHWRGTGPIVPYGIFRSDHSKRMIFVEGASDCWALWLNGYRALGLPGSSSARCLQSYHLNGVEEIFIWVEPDQGGKTFLKVNLERLGYLNFQGVIKKIQRDGVKDPCDLWVSDPKKFKAHMDYAIFSGYPVEKIVKPKSVNRFQVDDAKGYSFPALVGAKLGTKIICPYHDDQKASLHCYATHGHCFVCGAHKSAIDWLRDQKNLSFVEAVKALC